MDAYLYGRFEVGMRSVGVDGVVSSFFLYNLDVGCNWPAENNEIDIEMTGNKQNLLFTTHYPGPWYHTDSLLPAFNPHDSIHEYAIEWEPGVVRWFVDGQLANVQSQPFVTGLIYPMRIVMNLWVSNLVSWVGPWNSANLPLQSEYEYVNCYAYTPGAGTSGTNNNFSLLWADDFNAWDSTRWRIEEYGGFGGNLCTFKPQGVDRANGRLYLQLEEGNPNPAPVPVTFAVDMSSQSLAPTDVIYLNGSFNNWCGTCNPMSEDNGIWSLTLNLPPERHEYLFTKNFWEANGGAPLGSACDFAPCDQYGNYGVVVNEGSGPVALDTVCWGECAACLTTDLPELMEPTVRRKLIRVTDLLGREAVPKAGQVLLYHFDDGTREKRMVLR